MGVRPLARARRRVRLDLRRPARRDVPRPAARRDLVDPGRGRLRRDRSRVRVRPAVSRDRARRRSRIRPCSARRTRSSASRVSRAIPVSVEDVSGTTSQANAYAVGFGPSRKVVLWSTMVDGTLLGRRGARRPRPRDRAPLEQPHPQGARLVRPVRASGRLDPDAGDAPARRDGRGGGGSAGTPRRRRAPARARAGSEPGSAAAWRPRPTGRRCRRRGIPAAARGLFVGFGKTSLGDPDPPTWAHVLLDSHPTLAQRVAMAEAWAARNASAQGAAGAGWSKRLTGYSANASSAMSAIVSPIISDEVAPGDGAFRTWTIPRRRSRTKSSTRLPSAASAWARMPAVAGQHVARLELRQQLPGRGDEQVPAVVARHLPQPHSQVHARQATEARRSDGLDDVAGAHLVAPVALAAEREHGVRAEPHRSVHAQRRVDAEEREARVGRRVHERVGEVARLRAAGRSSHRGRARFADRRRPRRVARAGRSTPRRRTPRCVAVTSPAAHERCTPEPSRSTIPSTS